MLSLIENLRRQEAKLEQFKANEEQLFRVFMTDMLALIKERVIQRGERSDGQKIDGYSTKVVPTWYYQNAEARSQTAYERLGKKYGSFASYENWRDVNNLQTEKVDFFFTGKMWKSMTITIKRNGTGWIGLISPSTIPEQDKVKWLTIQKGEFLKPTEQELTILFNNQNIRIGRLEAA